LVPSYLAFDLGAESGRAILGQFHNGLLRITELHRFPNEPLRDGDSLRWNIRRLWHEIQHAIALAPKLDSIGVDTWGVDYALLDERGELLENPHHYRDRRTKNALQAVFEKIPRDRIYATTGIQFLPLNTLFQLWTEPPDTLARAASLATIPDLLNYWL